MNIRRLKPGTLVELICQHFVADGLGLSYFADEAFKEKFKPTVFFIWGVLPGERFVARLTKVKSKIAYGVLARRADLDTNFAQTSDFANNAWALRIASPERQIPACDHYLLCGGCRMQHMPYGVTLRYKKEWLLAQLQRHQIKAPDVEFATLPEKALWHYRNHVQVHINKEGVYGFYEPFSYRTRAFPAHGCLIFAEKKIRDRFPRFPVEVRAARIRLNSDGQAVFSILNSKDEFLKTARYTVSWPKQKTITIEFPVTCFFQANLDALPEWLETIKDCFDRVAILKPRVLELFSGFGFISRMQSLVRPMTVMGIDVLAAEQVRKVAFYMDAIKLPDNFSENYRNADLFLPERIARKLEEEICQFKPEILLINPPRAGLLPATWKKLRQRALADFRGPIIYSSCDAATMARDLAYFCADGYRCVAMKAFDFFAWTQHYETVSLLLRD